MYDDALTLVLRRDLLLDHRIKGAQKFIMPNEEVRFRAKVVEHTRHFDGDVACSHQSNLLGLFLKLEEAIAGDAKLRASDILRDGWMTTNCNEDFLGADGLFATVIEGDFDFIFREKMRAPMKVFYFVIMKVLFIDAIQPSDIGVALMLEGSPIEGSGGLDREAIGSCFLDAFGNSGGVECYFLGYTATRGESEWCSCKGRVWRTTNPTLTQVPPNRLLSTAIVFAS